jgi:hypothetical protein
VEHNVFKTSFPSSRFNFNKFVLLFKEQEEDAVKYSGPAPVVFHSGLIQVNQFLNGALYTICTILSLLLLKFGNAFSLKVQPHMNLSRKYPLFFVGCVGFEVV